MAKKPPLKTKRQRRRQAEVFARMQKDLEGYVDRYNEILEKRALQYAKEIKPIWVRTGKRILREVQLLLAEEIDAQGVPIGKRPIDPAKLRNMQRAIEHLTQLMVQVIGFLGGAEQAEKLRNNIAFAYTESYYFHAWGMEQATRLTVSIPLLSYNHVMGVIANPWLPDGNTYSERLRASTVYLAGKMRQAVEEAVTQGWDWNRTARRIQDIAGEGYYNAVRLARTELNRAASQASNHLFLQNADILNGKRWNATLDSRTAPKDAANHGKQYPIEYDTPEMAGRAGERIPNHPNCRCKYTPVLSALGVSQRERIARGSGDRPDNFGERIYTQAATYSEYAKERGIPDLDERLRNDDPRRYLRNDEK